MRLRKCAPQHASIATTHCGNFETNLISPSRVIRRRITTAPVASRPATLQLFLPRSTPKMLIAGFVIDLLLFHSGSMIMPVGEGRAIP